jgi:hypothetical protein
MTMDSELTQEQIDAFPYGWFEKYTYLGDLHWYQLVTCAESCPGFGKGPGKYHGIIQPHYKLDEGRWCAGSGPFRDHADVAWDVVSLEPLTLSPSLLCRYRWQQGPECGDHGFIREGKWVSA